MGGFSDVMLHATGTKYVGSHDCFAFILKPHENVQLFKHTKKNKFCIMGAMDYFSFGGGGYIYIYIYIYIYSNGAAIRLDSDLDQGQTYESETFGNCLMNNTESDNFFKCLSIEVYSIG